MFTWGPHPSERRAQRRSGKARNLVPGIALAVFILGFSIMPIVCAMRDASSRSTTPAPLVTLDLVPITSSTPAPAGVLPPCPSTGAAALQAGGVCVCSPAATAAGVLWGSGPYTTDSSPCRAARHAGALGAGGGVARFVSAPGQPSYRGTMSHGVPSSAWTSYPSSFIVERLATQPPVALAAASGSAGATIETSSGVEISATDGVTLSMTDADGVTRTFTGSAAAGVLAGMTAGSAATGSAAVAPCPPHLPVTSGTEPSKITCACAAPIAAAPVWGDRRYALDSGVCAAALHAEAIGAAGGTVRLWILPGCERYLGARRAGITSRAGEATDASFTFDVGVESSGLAGAPACPSAGRGGLATPAAP